MLDVNFFDDLRIGLATAEDITVVELLWARSLLVSQVALAELQGALDASGNLTGLHLRLSGQSIIAAVFPQNLQDGRDNATFQGLDPSGDFAFGYTVPNLLIDHAMRNTHVPVGPWRGERPRAARPPTGG